MPRPVVITTLQEDLRAIGLIEGDQEKLAPKADPEGGYAEDGGRDKPEDDPDTIKKEGRKGEGKVVKAGKPAGKKFEGRKGEAIPPGIGPVEGDDEPDDDEDDKDLPKAQEAIQAIRTLSRSFLRAHAPVGPKPVGAATESKKPQSRLEQLAEGKIYRSGSAKPATDRVASLLEEVAAVVGDIRRAQKEEQIKGFANVAMIAEHLSSKFRGWGMALSEGGLFKVSRQMRKLAEDAAAMAQKIDEPPAEEPGKEDEPEKGTEARMEADTDDKSVDDLFKKFMSKLLDALQLYNDVQGKATEGDEEDEPAPDSDEEPKTELDNEGDEEDEPAPDSDDEPKSEYTDEADDEDEPDDDEDDEEEGKDEGDEEDEPEDDDDDKDERAVEGKDEAEDDDEDDEDDEEESIDEAEGDDDDDDEKEEDDDSPYGVPVKDKDGEMSVGEAREFLAGFRKRLTEAKKDKKSPKGGKAASPKGKGGKKAPPSLAKQLSKRGDVKNPEALAAWLGMRKMGVGKFQKRAAAARKGGKKGKK